MGESSADITALLQSGFRYAVSLTHDSSRAEDVLQDAWLAVIKADGPHTRLYLFSAIRSRFLNANKREKLMPLVSIDDLAEIEEEPQLENEQYEIDNAVLESALASLRSVEREVLFLVAVEGYTAQEVAELTDRPRGTILSLLHRSRQKVKCFVELHDAKVMP